MRHLLVAGFLPVLYGTAGCGEGKEGDGALGRGSPNVYLIVLDAASAEFFGCYGAGDGASPNIDALASESILFERAYSQTPTTVSSTASLLTGVRATTHLMTSLTRLKPEFRTAAELLKEQGFGAFGFIGNPFGGAEELGFARGYDACVQVYALDALQKTRATEKSSKFKVCLPEDINEQVFGLLSRFDKSGTFVYIHYLQPHKPYDPPEEYLRRFDPDRLGKCRCGGADWDELHDRFMLANRQGRATRTTIEHIRARYRANIRYVDAGVGALLDKLKAEGLYDDALIVLTSDHGDAFFKHKLFGHNTTLYDDMTRIPLLVKFPKSDGIVHRRIPNSVETIDVLPTLFDYLGLSRPEVFEGDSLWPLILGEAKEPSRPEVVTCTVQRNKHAIRVRDYKYIYNRNGPEELYNLRTDPDEQRNLVGAERAKASALRAKLESMVDLVGGKTIESDNDLRSDPRMDALLKSLGYVGDEISDENRPSATTRPSP